MAKIEHVRVLINALASMSMKGWNQWRIDNPGLMPDLSGEELAQADLSFINLRYADLSRADLRGAKLHDAKLERADLTGSKFQNADLSRADLSFACLKNADLRSAVLRKAILYGANLQGARLDGADFRHADLADTVVDGGVALHSINWFNSGINRVEKLALGLFGIGSGRKRSKKDSRSGRPVPPSQSRYH
jgi:uncharacterized protein YjbI with pentapeptide repeats